VTLYDFGYVAQTLYHIFIHGAAFQRDAHIGAGGVAQTLGVYVEAATHDNAVLNEVLYALVNGSTRHVTLGSDILERNASILGENIQDFLVEIVNLVHIFFC
jgi:hypothetical protein